MICLKIKKLKIKNSAESGAMLVMALVFTTLFAVVAVGLAGMISSQHKLGMKKIAWSQALSIAEAGVNYYRWHMAHDESDYWDGQGEGSSGPYVHEYRDSSGDLMGYFSLEITAPSECSNRVTIQSTGWTINEPNVGRVVKTEYGKRSLASFAFLTNGNVWFGDSETLSGPLHSNGGIRMDGYNDGITTSANETYICGAEHGCGVGASACNDHSPDCNYVYGTGCVCDAIWGSGGDQALWDYPVSNVDFDAITTDLSELKTLAQNSMCSATEDCYWPQQGLGYRIEFLSDGTFNMYRVQQKKNPVWGYELDGWIRESDDIENTTFIGNYNIPGVCGIIFVEDDLWVDGTVNGYATVVAARLPLTGNAPKLIINGDIVYTAKNGSSALGLISQSDIYVPLYAAPDDLEINAVLMAQNGHVFRKYYARNGSRRVPTDARDYVIRDSLSLYGVIITNTIWTWTWVNGSGDTVSGYENTETIYDPNLTYNPPPGFPTTGEYTFLRWEEVTEKQ